jgi:hypothetical protein
VQRSRERVLQEREFQMQEPGSRNKLDMLEQYKDRQCNHNTVDKRRKVKDKVPVTSKHHVM